MPCKIQIILGLVFLAIITFILYNNIRQEPFLASPPPTNLFNDPRYEKNRTLLYGSLFLDNLDKQIKNMTDPPIQYDTKRIDIIKYADALL